MTCQDEAGQTVSCRDQTVPGMISPSLLSCQNHSPPALSSHSKSSKMQLSIDNILEMVDMSFTKIADMAATIAGVPNP